MIVILASRNVFLVIRLNDHKLMLVKYSVPRGIPRRSISEGILSVKNKLLFYFTAIFIAMNQSVSEKSIITFLV